ncbi:MAG TPA: hypothetical protein VD966_04430 [Pyrinomonadaceae bacterium]|nr:hypothetical protein [Pyrinomonadaceae bacterium]
MRRLIIFLTLVLLFALPSATTQAQSQTYTSDKVEFTLELPSPIWRMISEPDGINRHAEFINGERSDGYLQIHKEIVDAGNTPADLSRRNRDQKLHFLPGYVEGKEEKFAGRLSGVTFSYEFTSGGKPMLGRIYYLQADNRTIYTLRFTGSRDKLARIRNQTDLIARSFSLK